MCVCVCSPVTCNLSPKGMPAAGGSWWKDKIFDISKTIQLVPPMLTTLWCTLPWCIIITGCWHCPCCLNAAIIVHQQHCSKFTTWSRSRNLSAWRFILFLRTRSLVVLLWWYSNAYSVPVLYILHLYDRVQWARTRSNLRRAWWRWRPRRRRGRREENADQK